VIPTGRRRAVLTVDLEDYRRQELDRQFDGACPPHPREVERQLDRLLEIFAAIDARATFFTVGCLTAELDARAWNRIGAGHEIGCHGYDHVDVRR
jgi:peptidoglycan/xylan/chitin deacetylase (PgdA/CDA1 family)